jgi:hypothetical protein
VLALPGQMPRGCEYLGCNRVETAFPYLTNHQYSLCRCHCLFLLLLLPCGQMQTTSASITPV